MCINPAHGGGGHVNPEPTPNLNEPEPAPSSPEPAPAPSNPPFVLNPPLEPTCNEDEDCPAPTLDANSEEFQRQLEMIKQAADEHERKCRGPTVGEEIQRFCSKAFVEAEARFDSAYEKLKAIVDEVKKPFYDVQECMEWADAKNFACNEVAVAGSALALYITWGTAGTFSNILPGGFGTGGICYAILATDQTRCTALYQANPSPPAPTPHRRRPAPAPSPSLMPSPHQSEPEGD